MGVGHFIPHCLHFPHECLSRLHIIILPYDGLQKKTFAYVHRFLIHKKHIYHLLYEVLFCAYNWSFKLDCDVLLMICGREAGSFHDNKQVTCLALEGTFFMDLPVYFIFRWKLGRLAPSVFFIVATLITDVLFKQFLIYTAV